MVKKDFSSLADARAWIFGQGQNERANPGDVLDLKSKAGLSAFEISPAEIAEAAAAIKSCKEAGISLSEAVGFAIKHSRPPGGTKSLQEADALIKTKAEAGRSARHLRGLRWSLEKFADAQGKEKSVHELQRHDVETWLNAQSFSLKTRANYLRDLGILFNFALSRRWTAENPCAFIEKPSALDREVSALTPQDSSKLLAACPNAFLPGVCLKLFAGLRTSELLSLDWNEVSASEIVIRGAKAKTRQRRIVAISENLAAWLQSCRKPSGRVAPVLAERVASLAGNYRGICRADAFAQRPTAQLRQLSLRATPKRKLDRCRDGKFACDGLPALPGSRYTRGRGEILVSCPVVQSQRD